MLNTGDKVQLRTDLLHIGEIVGINNEEKIYTIIFNGIRFQLSQLAFDNLMRKVEIEHAKEKAKETKPMVNFVKSIIKKDEKPKKVKRGK